MSERLPERACPICGKPHDAKYRPFCSRRCADVDLGRWLKGGYSIPGQDADEGERPVDRGDSGTEDS